MRVCYKYDLYSSPPFSYTVTLELPSWGQEPIEKHTAPITKLNMSSFEGTVPFTFTCHHGSWLKPFDASAFKTSNCILTSSISTWVSHGALIRIYKQWKQKHIMYYSRSKHAMLANVKDVWELQAWERICWTGFTLVVLMWQLRNSNRVIASIPLLTYTFGSLEDVPKWAFTAEGTISVDTDSILTVLRILAFIHILDPKLKKDKRNIYWQILHLNALSIILYN